MSESKQLRDLPLNQLIGAPLSAISDGQVMLASATRDFIETVGLDENGQIRMVNFNFSRPEYNENPDGSVDEITKDYVVEVPFISIVSVPTLQVADAKIEFDLEIKTSSSQSLNKHLQPKAEGGQPVKKKANLIGTIASSSKKTSQSNYHVSLQAKQGETPEGLSRLLDILHRNIAPVEAPKNKD